MSMASHLSVSRRIRGGSFSSDACSAASHVRPISIFVPCIVLWPKDVAAVGARGVGVGTARKHASTQASTACASTPVKHEFPHPASSHAHMLKNMRKPHFIVCAGLPVLFPLMLQRARRKNMHGSYMAAYTARAKNVQENPHA